MFKKYIVASNSEFHKSIILSLFEKGEYGFHIEGLSYDEKRNLFSSNKIKIVKDEVDIKSVPCECVIVYLEDGSYELKALVIKNNNQYYLFKADHQKDNQLNIHQKYISSDLNALLDDFEKHSKTKGKTNYGGLGNYDDIKDINYFEYRYKDIVKNQIDKESSIYRLIFTENYNFTVDFVYLVKNKIITITNQNEFDSKVLTLETMKKHRGHRNDALFIDSNTKDISYFIFTYRPHLINHYYLFKNLGNDKFEFVLEDISFNKVLSSPELINIKYKKGSAFAAKSFAKNRYDNFSKEYIAFEEEEEFEEDAITQLELEESPLEITEEEKEAMLLEVKDIMNKHHLPLNVGLTTHGRERMLERLGEMSEEELINLANVAYEYGKNPVHFYEKDLIMFKFLRYMQGKERNKDLRIFRDVLFFFSMTPPHVLVTCFHYKKNYEIYLKNNK